MSVFGLFLLLVGTVLQVYVFWRALSLRVIGRSAARKPFLVAGVVLWVALALGHRLGHSSSGWAVAALELIGMNWFTSLFLTSFCLLIADVVTGFGFLMRRFVPVVRTAALLSGAALSVIAMVQGMRPPSVHEYEVRVSDLPAERDGMVIVALSDLHLGATIGPRWLSARVSQVQQLRPDLVVLLGDLLEGHGAPPANLLPELRRLSAPLGVWAVPGNHESFGGQEGNESWLGTAGIVLLRNRWQEIRPGLVLAGVEDLTVHRYIRRSGDPLSETLRGRPAGATVLLSHSPLLVQEAAAAGVSLMLCGHTHGGQVWPFNYLVQRMFPFMAGRYDVHGMPLIVSRGTGTWGPRMRLWRRGEILRIVLRR